MNRSCGEATVVSEDHQNEVSATRMTRPFFLSFLFQACDCRHSAALPLGAVDVHGGGSNGRLMSSVVGGPGPFCREAPQTSSQPGPGVGASPEGLLSG